MVVGMRPVGLRPFSLRRMGSEMDIKALVDRFLGWKLPADFSPDAGISFTPHKHQLDGVWAWPEGTNLFSREQATKMVEYIMNVSQEDRNMSDTRTQRLMQIADDLESEGNYTAAASVRRATIQRDELVRASEPFTKISETAAYSFGEITTNDVIRLRSAADLHEK